MALSQTKVFCSLCHLFVPVHDLEAHFRISPNHPSCNLCDIGFENNLTLTKVIPIATFMLGYILTLIIACV